MFIRAELELYDFNVTFFIIKGKCVQARSFRSNIYIPWYSIYSAKCEPRECNLLPVRAQRFSLMILFNNATRVTRGDVIAKKWHDPRIGVNVALTFVQTSWIPSSSNGHFFFSFSLSLSFFPIREIEKSRAQFQTFSAILYYASHNTLSLSFCFSFFFFLIFLLFSFFFF